jgi:hypothetical protein
MNPTTASIDTRVLLRHTLATLAYRCAKAIRGAPPEFATFRAGPTTKSPVEILAHIGDLLDWALSMARGQVRWRSADPLPWEAESARFFTALRALDDYLASSEPLGSSLEKLFQGPVADALTHTGQIAMLRRLSGAPMRGESYARAEIAVGKVGADQTPADPGNEFD